MTFRYAAVFTKIFLLLWLSVELVFTFDLSRDSRNVYTPRRRRTSLLIASVSEQAPMLTNAEERKNEAILLARNNEYSKGLEQIRQLFAMIEIANGTTRCELACVIEDSIGSFCSLAFSKPFKDKKARRRIDLGLEALELQLRSELLPSPYNQVSRNLFLEALRALSSIISTGTNGASYSTSGFVSTKMIFRILQRLLSGVGIRNGISGSKGLSQKDFNSVLNALVIAGRMDVAHKVVALQERTPSAPKLSPVTYSIILKGYGRIGDLESIEVLVKKAQKNKVVPDTVMLNSILDAYINCDKFEKADRIFQRMKDAPGTFSPNLRTYNTMLKGCARRGELDKALEITQLMKQGKLWDSFSTNTLVSVAVNAGAFEYAESVLRNNTLKEMDQEVHFPRRRQHPNVEAYTALLDGYAKSGDLGKAILTFQHMQSLGVNPNEYTYTCLIFAFAKRKKMREAFQMLDFMEERGIIPSSVTYNAFLSAIKEVGERQKKRSYRRKIKQQPDFVEIVNCGDEALALFRRMVKKGISPTVKNISLLLQCFTASSAHGLEFATAIVDRFERDGIIPRNNAEVYTSLMKLCGDDVIGALAILRKLEKPEVFAVNAFLDVACVNNMPGIALETFNHFFESKASTKNELVPDVITFSILITYHLKIYEPQKAGQFYEDMRSRGIKPDATLFDIILHFAAEVRVVRKYIDTQFLLDLSKDAEIIAWLPGELEQVKAAIGELLRGRIKPDLKPEDDLLRRKGWNKVDSGFRLWGHRSDSISADGEGTESDSFLASKGWNTLDSGFRII
mmetsp:Transcript_13460/g.19839  ORF Transcript_13460/g.19839 Transcript_13460/m.19839 type:complete len:794 (+) Transcript_13460:204-2585(+)|eukprot:CAMPEP_0194227312 /NCGR_PEP_ID=MMETSP0156-20130528/42794_1 /TAXON_ID=33649 /ORGANISM="Thalassionema nitzschioides, Strain L26-B" /LENGTH=793 /DNA_ID=CAMNT_0038959791 /DNA_START=116 /DNA_END=2497 /DNA_ORIENTATION=+